MRRRFSLSVWIAIVSTTLMVQAQKDIKPPETFTALSRRAAGHGFKAERMVLELAGKGDHCAAEAA